MLLSAHNRLLRPFDWWMSILVWLQAWAEGIDWSGNCSAHVKLRPRPKLRCTLASSAKRDRAKEAWSPTDPPHSQLV